MGGRCEGSTEVQAAPRGSPSCDSTVWRHFRKALALTLGTVLGLSVVTETGHDGMEGDRAPIERCRVTPEEAILWFRSRIDQLSHQIDHHGHHTGDILTLLTLDYALREALSTMGECPHPDRFRAADDDTATLITTLITEGKAVAIPLRRPEHVQTLRDLLHDVEQLRARMNAK